MNYRGPGPGLRSSYDLHGKESEDAWYGAWGSYKGVKGTLCPGSDWSVLDRRAGTDASMVTSEGASHSEIQRKGLKENTHHIVSPVSQYGGNVVDSIEDGTITDTQWAARLLLHHLGGK